MECGAAAPIPTTAASAAIGALGGSGSLFVARGALRRDDGREAGRRGDSGGGGGGGGDSDTVWTRAATVAVDAWNDVATEACGEAGGGGGDGVRFICATTGGPMACAVTAACAAAPGERVVAAVATQGAGDGSDLGDIDKFCALPSDADVITPAVLGNKSGVTDASNIGTGRGTQLCENGSSCPDDSVAGTAGPGGGGGGGGSGCTGAAEVALGTLVMSMEARASFVQEVCALTFGAPAEAFACPRVWW